MKRNFELEKRIKIRKDYDHKHGINSYGGMGMDGITIEEKKIIEEEINYISQHPEIYKKEKPIHPFPLLTEKNPYGCIDTNPYSNLGFALFNK